MTGRDCSLSVPPTLSTIHRYVRRRSPQAEQSGVAPQHKPCERRDMILIVDDDSDVRAMFCRALRELGWPAVDAPDGPTALAMIAEEKPQLVILDYQMPGMDGAEVARAIAEIDPDLPIIFSTGHSALRTLRTAAGEEAQILEKPFALKELEALIAEQLGPRALKTR